MREGEEEESGGEKGEESERQLQTVHLCQKPRTMWSEKASTQILTAQSEHLTGAQSKPRTSWFPDVSQRTWTHFTRQQKRQSRCRVWPAARGKVCDDFRFRSILFSGSGGKKGVVEFVHHTPGEQSAYTSVYPSANIQVTVVTEGKFWRNLNICRMWSAFVHVLFFLWGLQLVTKRLASLLSSQQGNLKFGRYMNKPQKYTFTVFFYDKNGG